MSYKCLSILQAVGLEDGDKCTLFSEFYHFSAIPWEEKDTAWEVKPNAFYQKTWIYMMAAEQGWPEMCRRHRPKAGQAPKRQQSGARVGAEFEVWDAGSVSGWGWSLGLSSSESFQKSGLGEGRSLGCASSEGDAPRAPQPATPSAP